MDNRSDPHSDVHAIPALPSVKPTTKEKRRASKLRRSAARHSKVPLSALPHDEAVLRSRQPPAGPPTLRDLAVQAAADRLAFGAGYLERLAVRLLDRATVRIGRAARFVDVLSGGAITRLF